MKFGRDFALLLMLSILAQTVLGVPAHAWPDAVPAPKRLAPLQPPEQAPASIGLQSPLLPQAPNLNLFDGPLPLSPLDPKLPDKINAFCLSLQPTDMDEYFFCVDTVIATVVH